MRTDRDYNKKFIAFKNQTLFEALPREQQARLRNLAFSHRLSFQEFRRLVEAARDLTMWGEGDLTEWWERQTKYLSLQSKTAKKELFRSLETHLEALRRAAKVYPKGGLARPAKRPQRQISEVASDKAIHGMCPVASDSTVCCNLRTIDAVENCAFGCSYCTIQTFYQDEFRFDADFAEKLKAIPLEPDRFYHFGTGQSSDSLVWGNRNGILDALSEFAADHPNVLLELKTKSDNISHFLDHDVPANIVCSWSLNTPTIISNEEHFTANLAQRLQAARRVADRGVKVAFHFHPMVFYKGWETEYPALAATVQSKFDSDEVLFISFGSVTMIKPAIKKIRKLGHATKILQMPMVPDPHGKLTYPDEIKIDMFSTMYNAFENWHDQVFMYLCMEKALLWQQTFGFVYPDNETFERDFGDKTMCKLAPRPAFAAVS